MNIVIAHFNTNWVNFSGGVEKVTCQLANALCKRGHQVTILYRDGKEGPPYFPLDSSVKTDNILFENGKSFLKNFLLIIVLDVKLPEFSVKRQRKVSMRSTRESSTEQLYVSAYLKFNQM